MMKRKSYEKIVSRNPCEEENFNLQNDGGSSYKKFFLTFEFLQFSLEKSILTFHFSLFAIVTKLHVNPKLSTIFYCHWYIYALRCTNISLF